MNEWLAPLIGFLVFLFFCPGVFVWVFLTNRQTAIVVHPEPRAERPARQGRTTKILRPVTTLLVLFLFVGCGISTSGDSTVRAGRPKGRTSRTVPAKTAHGNTSKRIESVAAGYFNNLPGEAVAGSGGVHASPSRTEYMP